MDVGKQELNRLVDQLAPEIGRIATLIGRNPELGHQERYAAELLTGFLAEQGFKVEKGIGGLATAFQAQHSAEAAAPKVGLLAEYDALPGVGHGCGHNLIAAASIGAAVALSRLKDLPGTVMVLGTPAEETSGAKVTLAEQGFFTELDAALMFHPGSQNVTEITTLALDAVEFIFHGKAAHAASAAQYGINALDAVINFFVGINALKKQLPDDARINGIITEGGITPNIVPERAVARLYIRSARRRELDDLRERVISCAQGAAAMLGGQVTWRKFELSYDEMCSNRPLADAFTKNLRLMGINKVIALQAAMGSVDMGNVSRVVPAIHPYLTLGDGMTIPHTREFAEAALSEDGNRLAVIAAKALAFTALDVLSDRKLLQKMKREFAGIY
ncbi:MAG: M20 family metallopeptidase [Peptococcaceae bacterium]|nr:M20 family metallopeptidase [Peptococcaceae bacterium]